MMTIKISLSLISFIALFSIQFFIQGCTSSVLSKRTDDQAWIEYQKELKMQLKAQRLPATVSDSFEKLNAALESIDFRKFVLTCHHRGDRECYETKLIRVFDETFRSLQLKQDVLNDVAYKIEQKKFLTDRSYENMVHEVQDFHRLLLSGIELRAHDRIEKLHEECEAAPETEVTSYRSFSGGLGVIPKGYFACLNSTWDSDANNLLSETATRLGISFTTQEAKDWIRENQIEPLYTQASSEIFGKKTKADEEALKENLQDLMQKMNWSVPLSQFVKNESQVLRERYPFVSAEVLLTELYQKHSKGSAFK